MTMVEKIARAIYDFPETPWEEMREPVRNEFRQRARAALEAMREPTDAMRNRYYELSFKTDTFNDGTWERSIDAALTDSGETG
ncbi:MAG: hypothetical protein Q8R92_21225 [Deltaproteobacteria bacterium]|nr:hypothetical protein [Deltaproteobacteria bacterium]